MGDNEMKYQITKVRDQIIQGAIAGLVGGIIQTVYAVSIKSLHFTDREFYRLC